MQLKSTFRTVMILLTLSLSFCLSAQVQQLPFETSFDTPQEKAAWQSYHTGNSTTTSWNFHDFGAFTAPSCVFHDYNVGASGTDTLIDWFVSPPINLSQLAKITLFIQNAGFSQPFPDSFEILVSSDSPDPETGNYVLIGNLSYMQPLNQWRDTTLEIPFTTPIGYIALKYKTIGASWFTPSFDDILIEPLDNQSINSPNSGYTNQFTLYPNPCSEELYLSQIPVSTKSVQLLDLSGRLLDEILPNSQTNIQLSINKLEPGSYIIRLVGQSTNQQSRIFFVN
ncbi:MAG TPA: choice-of-anchor J domain-containing protein [Flavobacteriales bacterium]|mgnify:CR=1 FL=1|nr:choice-of-anchor J domain-containing protein [Flavobacteriales bacterium]